MKVKKKIFGHFEDYGPVYLYSIVKSDLNLSFTNYGCIITSLKVPDAKGNLGEVVMGFDNFENYLQPHPYFGAVIGPVANRISGAKYTYNNVMFVLDPNEGENQLHGGALGFDNVVWTEESIIEHEDSVQLNFSYLRPDGLMGFPGNLKTIFSLTIYKSNRIDLNYKCETDQATPVNLTHHDYFNLTDGGESTILDHLVKINAHHCTPIKKDNCVTGEILEVKNTAFNFLNYKLIGLGIKELYGSTKPPNGFDHNFVLTGETPIAASVRCEKSRRQLDIYTNKDCVQFYTSNHLEGNLGRYGNEYKAFNAFCLETQSFPDAVNQKSFPNVILESDEIYSYFTSYVFSNY